MGTLECACECGVEERAVWSAVWGASVLDCVRFLGRLPPPFPAFVICFLQEAQMSRTRSNLGAIDCNPNQLSMLLTPESRARCRCRWSPIKCHRQSARVWLQKKKQPT